MSLILKRFHIYFESLKDFSIFTKVANNVGFFGYVVMKI